MKLLFKSRALKLSTFGLQKDLFLFGATVLKSKFISKLEKLQLGFNYHRIQFSNAPVSKLKPNFNVKISLWFSNKGIKNLKIFL